MDGKILQNLPKKAKSSEIQEMMLQYPKYWERVAIYFQLCYDVINYAERRCIRWSLMTFMIKIVS